MTAPATLIADYANGRLYIDPRILFTRASGGSYFDHRGIMRQALPNYPRLDYDSLTGRVMGLLLEGPRTNELSWCADYTNAVWAKVESVVLPNAVASLDGTVSAGKVVEADTFGNHGISYARNGSNETVTGSIFAKSAERSKIRLDFYNGAGDACGAYFDLAAGTITFVDGATPDYTAPAATIRAHANGWYRCCFTATKGTGSTSNSFRAMLLNDAGGAVYTGTGNTGLYMDRAQVEIGNFASSHIFTTSTSMARAGDSMAFTDVRWVNPVEGTLFAEVAVRDTSATRVPFILWDGTSSNRIQFHANNAVMFTSVGGVSQGTIGPNGGVTPFVHAKMVGRYRQNDIALAVNGVIYPDTVADIPPITGARFGGLSASGSSLFGWLRKASYVPRGLDNVSLQALSF